MFSGRLKFSKVAGMNKTSGKIEHLYAFGARGISIWRADDMRLVSDSGNMLEAAHAQIYPNIFNSHAGDLDETPAQSMDSRSDDKVS